MILRPSRKVCVFYEQVLRFPGDIDPNHALVLEDSFRPIRKFPYRDFAVLKIPLPTMLRRIGCSALCLLPRYRIFDLSGLLLLFLSVLLSFEDVLSPGRKLADLCYHTRICGKPFAPIRCLPSTILLGRDFCFSGIFIFV